MNRHAIFDLDGTLVDSVALCTQLLNGMLASRGSAQVIDVVDARRHVSLGGTHMVKALLGEACGDPDREIAEFRARYADAPTPEECLYPGVRAGLSELFNRGVRLSLCSNKPQALCEKVLRDLALDVVFDCVVGGRHGVAPKPSPALLELTLGQIQAQVDDCCFVGDSELDHIMARAVGMPFVFMTYGYCDDGHDASDAIHCNSFHEVADSVHALLDASRDAAVTRRTLTA